MKNTHGRADVVILPEQTGWLHALARGLVGDSHRAEELTQDTLLAAIEKPPQGASDRLQRSTWCASSGTPASRSHSRSTCRSGHR